MENGKQGGQQDNNNLLSGEGVTVRTIDFFEVHSQFTSTIDLQTLTKSVNCDINSFSFYVLQSRKVNVVSQRVLNRANYGRSKSLGENTD